MPLSRDWPQNGPTGVGHDRVSVNIFLYGSLLDVDLLETVLGRAPDPVNATLEDHAAYWIQGQEFPMILQKTGQVASGLLLENLTETDVARLDFYEGPYGYTLQPVHVQTVQGRKNAQVFFPEPGAFTPGHPWNVSDWTARHGPLQKIAAREIMSRFGVLSAQEVADRWPVIQARAQQVLNAQTRTAPLSLRVKSDAQGIDLKSKETEHDKWFLTEELFLTHPRYDGTQSPTIARTVFVMADAVTVLPYDPKRDMVMLIEQFRAGCFRRGDLHPWSLEVIAGRIDGGEPPERAARREALEETGLNVEDLHRIGGYYASPGAATEYLTSFVALADLPDDAAGVGGLDTEDEDIRAMVIPFHEMMAAVQSGEAENAPLLISALWLAANRDRLRTSG